jgi:hypothetical protein
MYFRNQTNLTKFGLSYSYLAPNVGIREDKRKLAGLGTKFLERNKERKERRKKRWQRNTISEVIVLPFRFPRL